METPSSTRRVTRSQTLASLNNSSTKNNIPSSRKIEDSADKGLSKSRPRNTKNQQQDRSVLIDITNDSPIVGLATGSLETPSSAIAKQRSCRAKNKTPGSGEALLRGQVKTLLQKVEEEAELSKLSLKSRPFLCLQANSPFRLLAPTPMNTPLVPNLSEDGGANNNGLASVTVSPVVDESLDLSQVVNHISDGVKQQSLESEKSLTRSLLLDFTEKSESSSEGSSVVTYQGQLAGESECSNDKPSPLQEDDAASIRSIQVNASTHDEDEEEEIEEEDDCEYHYEDEEGKEEDDDDDGFSLMDELCAGLNNMSVNGGKPIPKFAGKHTRFVYNSDDEIVGEEECDAAASSGTDNDSSSAGLSPSILRLKGLPTPKGKHIRFPLEADEDDNNNN